MDTFTNWKELKKQEEAAIIYTQERCLIFRRRSLETLNVKCWVILDVTQDKTEKSGQEYL